MLNVFTLGAVVCLCILLAGVYIAAKVLQAIWPLFTNRRTPGTRDAYRYVAMFLFLIYS